MSLDEEKKLKAMIVLDIIGRPAEHLKKALNDLIDKIDSEKGVTVTGKSIKDPVPMKNQESFFTTFAEVELEIDEFLYFMIVIFKYMPAHVEVIEPEFVAMTNNGWNDILNEIARRLHSYDEIARMMQAENQMLQNRIMQLTGEKMITPMTLKSELTEDQLKKLQAAIKKESKSKAKNKPTPRKTKDKKASKPKSKAKKK